MKNLILKLEYQFKSQNFTLKKLDLNFSPQENIIRYDLKDGVLFLYPDPHNLNTVKNILIPSGTANNQLENDNVNLDSFDVYFCVETYFKICKSK